MPNDCANKLVVLSKDNELIEEFKRLYCGMKDDGMGPDFNKIVPEPKVKEECDPACLVTEDSHITADKERPWFDWYRWHNKYWGTKWNAYGLQYTEDIICKIGSEKYHGLELSFYTAWGPAIGVFEKLIEIYEDHRVIFKYSYYEPGNFFAGMINYNPVSKEYDGEEYGYDSPEKVKEIAQNEGFDDCEWMDEIIEEDDEDEK